MTADHGHMDSKGVSITEYPSITECLVHMPSIEPRALNFFVKEDKKEQFEREFQKAFGEKFLLYSTKEEADFFIGVHAGLTEDEMTIPLIIIETKEKV